MKKTKLRYKTWDIANMVQDWVDTPSENYGVLINSDDTAAADSNRYEICDTELSVN